MEDTYRIWGRKVNGQGHVTFDLLLENFNMGHNFFILRDRAFKVGICVPIWQGISDGNINFEHMNSNMTFDLLLNNF